MKYDLIIKNGLVVFKDELKKSDLAVKDGKIAYIADSICESKAEKVIDAEGQYVMPGMVDSHFHASDPGGVRSDWEGFETGTKALAVSGTTTYVDMPLNTLPATTNKESFKLKMEAAKNSNYVDYAFYGGLTPYNLDDLEDLDNLGAVAYKCFTATCGSPEIEGDFKNVDDYDLYMGMKKLAELNQMLCIHAENPVLTDRLAKKAVAEGKSRPTDYVNTRPVFTEVDAVQSAIIIAKETGCKVHFMHISSADAVELITKHREEGMDLTIESCPHYFVLTTEDFERIGNKCKCSPPLRDKENMERMWKLLMQGKIDTLSSDHSPCPFSMKDYDNVFDAWGGISGCQNNVYLMFDEAVKKRGMNINDFAKTISFNPAKLYSLKNKGEIALSMDADIILLDPNASYVVKEEDLYYRNKHTAYAEKEIGCRVTKTILRGEVVYDLEEGIVGQPKGQFIKKK